MLSSSWGNAVRKKKNLDRTISETEDYRPDSPSDSRGRPGSQERADQFLPHIDGAGVYGAHTPSRRGCSRRATRGCSPASSWPVTSARTRTPCFCSGTSCSCVSTTGCARRSGVRSRGGTMIQVARKIASAELQWIMSYDFLSADGV